MPKGLTFVGADCGPASPGAIEARPESIRSLGCMHPGTVPLLRRGLQRLGVTWTGFVLSWLAVLVPVHGWSEEPAASSVSNSPPARAASGSTGISYRNEKIPEKPLSIHIVKVDRSRSDLVLATTLAKGTVLDLCPLSEQVKTLQTSNARPMVAINGDFYRTEHEPFAGDPLGFQVMQGELVSSGHTNLPCFWMDGEGQPHIGIIESKFQATLPDGTVLPFELNEERVRGSARVYTPRLGASTQTPPLGGKEILLKRVDGEDWLPIRPGRSYVGSVSEIRDAGNTKLTSDILILSIDSELLSKVAKLRVGEKIQLAFTSSPNTEGCEVAIGGGPTLVKNGALPNFRGRNINEKHPRSAFGWNDQSWFFVEVDGRQSNLSIGMTVPELGEYLLKLGAKEALNLDGGGSATLWLFGQVANSPCYGYERNTANGLVILKKDSPRREPD